MSADDLTAGAPHVLSRDGRRRIGVVVLVLVAVMAAFHTVVAVVGEGRVDVWSMAVLAVAALVVLGGLVLLKEPLRRVPYALFAYHVVSYTAVVGSTSVHALVAGWTAETSGGLVWMVGLWTLGMFAHALASIWSDGLADAEH